jgi:hypothetical protein
MISHGSTEYTELIKQFRELGVSVTKHYVH